MPAYVGDIEQVPPQFSAVKVDGERAYLRTALPASQQVVVAGGQYLNDGTPVKLTN